MYQAFGEEGWGGEEFERVDDSPLVSPTRGDFAGEDELVG